MYSCDIYEIGVGHFLLCDHLFDIIMSNLATAAAALSAAATAFASGLVSAATATALSATTAAVLGSVSTSGHIYTIYREKNKRVLVIQNIIKFFLQHFFLSIYFLKLFLFNNIVK